jgi:hypothetical protein
MHCINGSKQSLTGAGDQSKAQRMAQMITGTQGQSCNKQVPQAQTINHATSYNRDANHQSCNKNFLGA